MDKKTLTYLTILTAVIATGLILYTLKSSTEKTANQTTTKESTATTVAKPKPTPSFTFSPKEPEQPRPLVPPTPSANKPTRTPQLIMAEITSTKFSPDPINVEYGDIVNWTNKDTNIHTIIGKSWEGNPLKQGESFGQTFDVPGTYQYYSKENPTMVGTITVK